MAAAIRNRLMSAGEFLSIPQDGMDRELIDGRLRERPHVYRDRFQSPVTACLSCLLKNWNDTQSEPRGTFFGGDVGCRLFGDADSVVGIDIAFWTAEQLDAQSDDDEFLNGPPKFAIEILSPSDTCEYVAEKLALYLHQDVELVWIVDPYQQTITVHQPHHPPYMVNIEGVLTGEDVLPGFRVAVKEIFE